MTKRKLQLPRKKGPKPKLKFPLIIVEWEDSGGIGGWVDIEIAQNLDAVTVVSSGQLIAVSETEITMTLSASSRKVHHTLTIPKSSIVSLRYLPEIIP
jgi:hypothetical protein